MLLFSNNSRSLIEFKSQATGNGMQLLSIQSYHTHHIQIHRCWKKVKHTFLTYLRKLFSSVHCAYRNRQNLELIPSYTRDWSHFHTYKKGVTWPPSLDNPKLYYVMFFFFNFFYTILNVIKKPFKKIWKKIT